MVEVVRQLFQRYLPLIHWVSLSDYAANLIAKEKFPGHSYRVIGGRAYGQVNITFQKRPMLEIGGKQAAVHATARGFLEN